MLKVIGVLYMVASGVLLTLGNFWFTYGIWPKSYWMLGLFACLNLLNWTIVTNISKEISDTSEKK